MCYRIQHIFNNPLSFLGLLVLSIWKSVYNRWTVCMCWCNLIFSEQGEQGLSPMFPLFLLDHHMTARELGCGTGWLPWLFHLRLIGRGFFCSLSTGRECVLFFSVIKRWWNWVRSSCNTVPAKSRFAINVAGMVLEDFVLWISTHFSMPPRVLSVFCSPHLSVIETRPFSFSQCFLTISLHPSQPRCERRRERSDWECMWEIEREIVMKSKTQPFVGAESKTGSGVSWKASRMHKVGLLE